MAFTRINIQQKPSKFFFPIHPHSNIISPRTTKNSQKNRLVAQNLRKETMANNRKRLEDLESSMGMVQDELLKLTTGITDKYKGLEDSFNRTMADYLREMRVLILSSRDTGSSASYIPPPRDATPPHNTHTDDVNPFAPAPPGQHRRVKLELSRFSDGDPTEWLTKATQYFPYHDITGNQRVNFASYHLTVEANEWWQATVRAISLKHHLITWETFEGELWTRFGRLVAQTFTKNSPKSDKPGHSMNTNAPSNDYVKRCRTGQRKRLLEHSSAVSISTLQTM